MKLNEVNDHIATGLWTANWKNHCPDVHSSQALLRAYQPKLLISLGQYYRNNLNEVTYKELTQAIDPNFLRQGIRAAALKGVRFIGFDNDTINFRVTASLEHRPYGQTVDGQIVPDYLCQIKFMQWDDIGGDPEMSPRDKSLLLLWTSDIKVYCNDPSFLYWGYRYILTQLDASIYPENRPPHINNPGLRGVVDKHLNRVLKALPFYSGDIAKEITNQFGGKISKREIDAIRRRNDLWKKVNQVDTTENPSV